jgi:hypothetical protein
VRPWLQSQAHNHVSKPIISHYCIQLCNSLWSILRARSGSLPPRYSNKCFHPRIHRLAAAVKCFTKLLSDIIFDFSVPEDWVRLKIKDIVNFRLGYNTRLSLRSTVCVTTVTVPWFFLLILNTSSSTLLIMWRKNCVYMHTFVTAEG